MIVTYGFYPLASKFSLLSTIHSGFMTSRIVLFAKSYRCILHHNCALISSHIYHAYRKRRMWVFESVVRRTKDEFQWFGVDTAVRFDSMYEDRIFKAISSILRGGCVKGRRDADSHINVGIHALFRHRKLPLFVLDEFRIERVIGLLAQMDSMNFLAVIGVGGAKRADCVPDSGHKAFRTFTRDRTFR